MDSGYLSKLFSLLSGTILPRLEQAISSILRSPEILNDKDNDLLHILAEDNDRYLPRAVPFMF